MSDMLVFAPRTDQPTLPNPWARLPPAVAALVADPLDWGVFVTPVNGKEPWNLIATAVQEGRLQLGSAMPIATPTTLPALAPAERSLADWKQAAVAGCHAVLGQSVRSKVDLIALQAGVLQMGDHLTPSHEHSQSIEGRGKHQAGDYWHAINHRREPDYGNAKYWFRHVGNHPLLAEMASVIPELAREFSSGVQSTAAGLIEGGRLDPFRFVDLVSEACRRKDADLICFAERLQWIEMVGLMEWTLKDAGG